MSISRLQNLFIVLAVAAGLAGCSGRAYVHEPFDLESIEIRAESKTDGPIRVSASVPGRDETRAIFGIDLYDQGIQPVWLEIENTGSALARYAPASTDREYFAPLEVSYKNRRGYSDEARAKMDKRFSSLAMPRYILAGETRAGFVFTHVDSGAKIFNVDVFSSGNLFSFNFLMRVPGFTPDYARLDIASIYAADAITEYDAAELPGAIRALPCCSANARGNVSGAPINIVLIGQNRELLIALLRSGWRETAARDAASLEPQYLFGREQDAIFRYQSAGGDSTYELRVWLAPIKSGGDNVWAGQVRHFYSWFGIAQRFDADVDAARNFTLQRFLYSQAVSAIAWIRGEEVVPPATFWSALINTGFFTDGYQSVTWLSAEPYSPLEVNIIPWDELPRWTE